MSKKTVCIVGRPNVGKSTLFNKIVGKRIAITENTPGVTRDRIYADAEWQGREFTMIDTGGVDPREQDEFMKGIRAQVDIAIDHADVIIFLVDGVSGLTSTDSEIAKMLFKSKKDIILAVNKVDTKGVMETKFDYYELGFGDPFMISAENSIGLGDLLDQVIIDLDAIEKDDIEDERIKVAFIGKPNVGKSSTVNKLIGEDRSIVTNIPGTTRDSIDSEMERDGVKFLFIDTAGLRKKKKIFEDVERYSVVRTLASIDRADVCVGIIDA
ncbi:MAG: ribosome biogenesis GTPase Der, partial [Gallicola sp.]|nr:ribosome biogenesis GTPase Der [Gallicola sp.]